MCQQYPLILCMAVLGISAFRHFGASSSLPFFGLDVFDRMLLSATISLHESISKGN